MPTFDGTVPGYPQATTTWDGTRLIKTVDHMVQVRADNDSQGPLTIIASLSIPVGEPWSEDQHIRAKQVGPAKRADNGRLLWHIPIFYTNQFSIEDAEDSAKAPNQRRVKKNWTFETLQVPFTKDAIDEDTPITNSADEPIEDLVDFVIPVLNVERFEVGFDEDTVLTYANHTNANTFLGAPPKTVLCAGIEANDEGSENIGNEVWEGILYQRVRYVFKFKIPITEENKGWVARYVDVGSRYKSGNNYLP